MLHYTYTGCLVELSFCSTFRPIAPSPNLSPLIQHILCILKIKNGLQYEVIHNMLTIMGFPFLYAKVDVIFPCLLTEPKFHTVFYFITNILA